MMPTIKQQTTDVICSYKNKTGRKKREGDYRNLTLR